MTAATGNIYTGLQEFQDMAFVVHLLRPGDLFVDVGANVGSYTVLAGGVAGANVLCFEPIPQTFARLQANIELNELQERVRALNVGVGSRQSSLRFTAALDTINHVLSGAESGDAVVDVPVDSLERFLAGECPVVMKIDVEGFETEVIAGATEVLKQPDLLAMVIELNGSGLRYGFDENALAVRIEGFGFSRAHYDPFSRKILPSKEDRRGNNSLYVRDFKRAQQRLSAAPSFVVHGRTL